jgi:hypothetical protein
MTQQLIIVGTPNSREGDSLFAAFTKINDNFSVIYTALGLGNDTTLNLGDFEFTNSTMTNTNSSTIIVGKASTDTVVVGDTSQTTTIESQIEIETTGITIAKRLIETNDDGVTTATDNLGSVVELTNASASIGRYLNPEGPDNTLYSRFTTSGGAIIETVVEDVGSTSYGRVNAGGGDVVISASDGVTTSAWSFAGDGTLRNAVGSFTKTTSNELLPGVAAQVVWTASQTYISGAKLTIQVEANEVGGSNELETQVCEAIVAVRGYATASQPEMVVYGIVHTSVAPLMTFTVDRNIVTDLIEIVGTRTVTASPSLEVGLQIYSVETKTNF